MIKECNFANRKRKRDIRACLEHVGRCGLTHGCWQETPLTRNESEASRRMAARDTAHTSRNKATNTVYIYIFK